MCLKIDLIADSKTQDPSFDNLSNFLVLKKCGLIMLQKWTQIVIDCSFENLQVQTGNLGEVWNIFAHKFANILASTSKREARNFVLVAENEYLWRATSNAPFMDEVRMYSADLSNETGSRNSFDSVTFRYNNEQLQKQ